MHSLKKKIIIEYNKFIRGLNLGKRSDYHHIIDMLNLLDVYPNVKRPDFIESHFINL